MNKQIMGIVATLLMLGTALAPEPIQEQSAAFQIRIIKDATITFSGLRIDSGTALNFEPGITLINESEALPTNANNDSNTLGHWSITNVGNINANITVELNTALPVGVISEIGTSMPYLSTDYTILSINPALYVDSPVTKGETINFWQRIAADNTATGNDTVQEGFQVVITSIPQ